MRSNGAGFRMGSRQRQESVNWMDSNTLRGDDDDDDDAKDWSGMRACMSDSCVIHLDVIAFGDMTWSSASAALRLGGLSVSLSEPEDISQGESSSSVVAKFGAFWSCERSAEPTTLR